MAPAWLECSHDFFAGSTVVRSSWQATGGVAAATTGGDAVVGVGLVPPPKKRDHIVGGFVYWISREKSMEKAMVSSAGEGEQ